jgi:hypothetical protein
MVGRAFVLELLRHGFIVKRRSRSLVWISRGEQRLMLDEEAEVPDGLLARLLTATVPPPASAGPISRPITRPISRPITRPIRRP